MRVLLTGAGGQLGRAIVGTKPNGMHLVELTHDALDIGSSVAVGQAIDDARPDTVINAAGYTRVDAAETQRDDAFIVNRDGPELLARAAFKAGAMLIHVSSDFVFSGQACEPYRPDDEPLPVSVYGESKLAGERAVLEYAECVVIRTSWLYSSTGRNFALSILRAMREGQDLRVVVDQVGTPTWCRSLAQAIWSCVRRPPAARVLHWTDLGVASRYDFAVAIHDIGRELGLIEAPVSIVPISTAEYPSAARRPAYSVLESASTRRALDLDGAHWRHNLKSMLEELARA